MAIISTGYLQCVSIRTLIVIKEASMRTFARFGHHLPSPVSWGRGGATAHHDCPVGCRAPRRCANLGSAGRAIGSAGERLVHTEEVTGSIPVSPTEVRP